MSNPVVVPPGDIGPFQINFFQACLPPLQAGNYTLVANQQVQNLKDEPQPPQFDATQPFRVDGPRYTLNPTDIHMVYPPANQQGQYTDTLPNITFTQRALPWARSIGKLQDGATDDSAPTPWIALLTFYPGELTGMPVQMQVSEIINPTDKSVLGPALEDVPADELEQNALALDVDLKLFLGIAPQYAELQYLAHARQVNTDGKVILGLNGDGFFSVLVGNRVAYTPPDNDAKGATNNTVILVSLEGHQNHLPPAPSLPSNITKIRLICLASWKFTAEATPGDFLDLMRLLPKRGGVKLLQMPYTMEGTLSPEQQLVKEALDIGFVPLQNNMRDGEQATAWYRGPFIPVITVRDIAGSPYHFSDHAMHYDPDNGIFNLAYAAAWQIGRLLALSDKSFAMALFKWRQEHQAKIIKMETRATQQQHLSQTLDFPPDPSSILGEAAFRKLLANFWTEKVRPVLDSRENPIPRVQPREQRLNPAAFPGVLSPEELDEVLSADAEPMLALRRKIFGS